MGKQPREFLGGLYAIQPRCPVCDGTLENSDRDVCPRCGPWRRPIGTHVFLLVAALHLIISFVVMVVGMGLIMQAPESPEGPLLDAIAKGLLIVTFWPAFLLDLLGADLMRYGLGFALPISTLGWCVLVYLLIASARLLRGRRPARDALPRAAADPALSQKV
jgi:hypothetical protein